MHPLLYVRFKSFFFIFRLFGYPFFEGSNASEILRLNRKFTTEFDGLNTVRQELKNPNSKINKDGKRYKNVANNLKVSIC